MDPGDSFTYVGSAMLVCYLLFVSSNNFFNFFWMIYFLSFAMADFIGLMILHTYKL